MDETGVKLLLNIFFDKWTVYDKLRESFLRR